MLGVIIVILLAIVAILVVGAPLWLLVLWIVGNRLERRRRAEDERAEAEDFEAVGQTCPACGHRLVSARATCPNCGESLPPAP